MKKTNNIIFDFDGTLVDTAPLIVKTMISTIEELNLPKRSESECKLTIGLRLEDVPAMLWPEKDNLSLIFANTYRRLFDELKRPLDVKCFPDVINTLQDLYKAGVRMAIASSRSHKSLEEYISLFELDKCFCQLVGGNDVTNGKPSPEPVLTILEQQNWIADETLTVGDATVDIMMGKTAGTQTCAVTYGNGIFEELKATNPDYLIDSFADLRDFII